MNKRTFCSDETLVTGSGFVNAVQGVKTEELIDQTADIDYHICNKMGTSIPTIFSRMFLFSSAYNDINELEGKMQGNEYPNKGKAHDYVINPESGQPYSNVYHHLISEHLDMLEFLFFYGEKLTMEKWSLTEFKNLIKGEGVNEYNKIEDDGLNRLADALVSAWKNTPVLKDMPDVQITLFRYEHKLLGGTSPDFMVFTNPNWKSIVQRDGMHFEYNLFNCGTPRPLQKRDFRFKKLLTLMARGGKLDGLSALKRYINDNKEMYDDQVRDWWNDTENSHPAGVAITAWVDEEIAKIASPLMWSDNGNTTAIVSPLQNVPLYVAKADPDFNTDYKIAPTRARSEWEKETVNGAEVKLKGAPMLVLPNGIPGARYHEKEPWNPATTIPVYGDICNKYLSQREAPGKSGLKYPYITADDLLEDKIVELAYNIDKEHFFTACNENMNYMLPIKKNYFRFFGFEDLRKNFKIELKRDVDDQVVKVCVSLTLPMESKRVGSVTVKREYEYVDEARYKIVNCKNGNTGFDIGIFPFYRVTDADKQTLNNYRFMCGYTATEVECWAGTFDKAGFIVPKDGYEGQKLDFRRRTASQNYGTAFAERNGSFDYLEVEVTANKQIKAAGMFFPIMTQLSVRDGLDNLWYYSVDFGTSNTHIVMAKSIGSVKDEAVPFGYGMESRQMVTLGVMKQNYKFVKFKSDVQREFAPETIVSSGDGDMKFPIRSVVYEKNGAGMNVELFSERNIGFKFKSELSAEFVGNKYCSDLKWQLRHQQEFEARVDAYCYQIIWMLRNHSLCNGGTEKIQVAVTYPISMRPNQLRTIKDAWRIAWRQLVDANNDFPQSNFFLESAAPYKHSLVTNAKLNRTDAYVNVDIGGGSTDLLYYKSGQNGANAAESHAYSVFFAANDLWGSGISQINAHSKDNGFIANLEKNLAQPKKDELKRYKTVATNASDVVSFLFSEPDKWHFEGNIKSSPVASVVVMHFAATMYYLASIINNNKRLEIPRCINFTGMGSKYLTILSSTDEELAQIIQVVFSKVMTDSTRSADISKIKVTRSRKPKEVTALGAMYMLDDFRNRIVNMKTPDMKTVYCIDGEENLESPLNYTECSIMSAKPKVDAEIRKFIEMLKSREFCNAVVSSGVDYSFDILERNGLDNDVLNSSFLTVIDGFDGMSDHERQERLKDAPFFWPLKDALYTIALRISNN